MSKMSWIVIAMIIWALVSMYWYCNLKTACNEAAAPAVAQIQAPRDMPVTKTQPVKEIKKDAVETAPIKLEKAEVAPEKIVEEKPAQVPKVVTKCADYLAGNLKPGNPANKKDVATKVEKFLNDYENTDLPVDGIYGPGDVRAINAFQQKYKSEILTPLGLTSPTGNVLGSTREHINNLYCQNLKKQ